MEDRGFVIYTMDTEEFADEAFYRKCYDSLSARRRETADRYRYPEDRKLSVAAGVLLDRGLKEYGLWEKNVRIGKGENGKPYLIDYPDIHYNLSHSGGMVLAVFSDTEIGCDIEAVRQANLKLAKRFFCPGEYAYIADLKGGEQDREFCRLWTLKESFLKSTGMGLRLPLDSFEFQFLEEGAVRIRQDYDDESYVFYEYDFGLYHAAVCIRKK